MPGISSPGVTNDDNFKLFSSRVEVLATTVKVLSSPCLLTGVARDLNTAHCTEFGHFPAVAAMVMGSRRRTGQATVVMRVDAVGGHGLELQTARRVFAGIGLHYQSTLFSLIGSYDRLLAGNMDAAFSAKKRLHSHPALTISR